MHTDRNAALSERQPSSASKDSSGLAEEPRHSVPPLVRADDDGADSSPAEPRHESGGTEISLLELAEILDQHKAWAESGGENGQRADLCGVNLSNADLTGVNLQGAVLRRANLFDALLPESIAAVDSAKAIDQATKVGRIFYFLTLGICAACCLLIAFTTDVRLIVDGPAIPIGRLGKALPMSGFYLGAPLLLFFLYLRFHFLLLSLWGNMAALPAVFPDEIGRA